MRVFHWVWTSQREQQVAWLTLKRAENSRENAYHRMQAGVKGLDSKTVTSGGKAPSKSRTPGEVRKARWTEGDLRLLGKADGVNIRLAVWLRRETTMTPEGILPAAADGSLDALEQT